MNVQLNDAQLAILKAAGMLPTTEAQTEVKAPATSSIPVRKANGLTPLYKVLYTSKAGNTSVYGVAWEGPDRYDPNVKTVCLRRLVRGGHRMHKRNPYSGRGFFVKAADCTPI